MNSIQINIVGHTHRGRVVQWHHPNGDAPSTCKKSMRTHASTIGRQSWGEIAWGHMLLTCYLPTQNSVGIDGALLKLCPYVCLHMVWCMCPHASQAWGHMLFIHLTHGFITLSSCYQAWGHMLKNLRTHSYKHKSSCAQTCVLIVWNRCPYAFYHVSSC